MPLALRNHNTTLLHAYNCMEAAQDSLTDLKKNTEKIKNKINMFELSGEKMRNEDNTETNSNFQQFH